MSPDPDPVRTLAERIMAQADRQHRNGMLSLSETSVHLAGTVYRHFGEWLTGLNQANKRRWADFDQKSAADLYGSGDLDFKELTLAVATYVEDTV